MPKLIYKTPGGISVTRQTSSIPYHKGLGQLLHKLDRYRGIYLSSGYEYPERYSRWDVASVCPPIEIVAAGRDDRVQSAECARRSAERRCCFACSNGIRIGNSSDLRAPRCMDI